MHYLYRDILRATLLESPLIFPIASYLAQRDLARVIDYCFGTFLTWYLLL